MATVIKSGEAQKLMTGFKHLALRDHMAEVRATVREARDQAREIAEAARREAVGIRAEARQAGYGDGFAEGREAGLKDGHAEAYRTAKETFAREQSRLASVLAELADAFESSKQALLDKAERDLLGFALAATECIVKRTGHADREVAVQNARAAIDGVGAWTDLVIRVSPTDHAAVGEFAEDVGRSLDERRHIRVMDDPSIEPGGCVVESSTVRVDASLRTQFSEMVDLLLGSEAEASGV